MCNKNVLGLTLILTQIYTPVDKRNGFVLSFKNQHAAFIERHFTKSGPICWPHNCSLALSNSGVPTSARHFCPENIQKQTQINTHIVLPPRSAKLRVGKSI